MKINYSLLARRINKAIDKAALIVSGSKVHIVTIDDDISELSGLVVILNPNKPATKQDQKTA